MKLKIVLKNGNFIDVDGLPDNFNFQATCIQVRAQGFFQSEAVHVNYSDIGALLYGTIDFKVPQGTLQ